MSIWHDLVVWVDSYPFGVAKPEEIFHFYWKKGFELVKLQPCESRSACNEYVFIRGQKVDEQR